jgi:ParB family chromosome partitioning protein
MAKYRKRSPRLGRGLSSLISQPVQVDPPSTDTSLLASGPVTGVLDEPTVVSPTQPGEAVGSPDMADAGLVYVDVTGLVPNSRQPRRNFDKVALQHLADSIKADGLMQPVIARPAASQDGDQPRYEIVVGERRWRAASMAGLGRIPAIVHRLDDQQMAQWSLVENLQREDLNPMERAEAYARLANDFGLSHEEIATSLGLDRASVSNMLRLLKLCDFVQQLVRDGHLSMGQARALSGLSDAVAQQQLAQQAIRQAWSVRQVEKAVKAIDITATRSAPSSRHANRSRPAHLADLEQQLSEQLQTKVKLRPGRKKGSGTLSIEFYSLDQFDALLAKLGAQMQ